ncbi:hypothetical protein K491DRAFT_651951 [Lophiostoma macrostomum CBS 122681]|uniref:DH domain-containing protein n=1 Tax=Lophiostoma macrostomum CBS 122681 TaxID=1314788 RepID=A0A6A6THX1_9PLEO|nr:hypothetical protein K491DRAFT_651951 [Lophiostoma macrostomum CBS 122681]
METVSAALGIVTAIPICLETAKQLYDLRAHYKDASVLITAIYSESLVIAASLSQVQSLLERDTLRSKPQLYETFDQALTGCRVVYTCLEEEVGKLADKAAADHLGRRDRIKYLLKEDTFKELLLQIRGQQSSLSLLIQGLQMESMDDLRKLIEENGKKLDQVAKRSSTLRQAHPRIKVPDSVFDKSSNPEGWADAQTILSSTEFTFDQEVINSKAYRRAMALATLRAESKEPMNEVEDGDLIDLNSPTEETDGESQDSATIVAEPASAETETNSQQKDGTLATEKETEFGDHDDFLDALESSMLPFMLPSLALAAPVDSSELKNVWMSLLTEEEKLVERMTKFRKIFYTSVVAEWPSLAQHLEAVTIFDKIAPLHEQYMLKPLRSHLSRGDCTLCAETIFETWATKTHALYRDYAKRIPHAESSLRLTQNMDQKFTPFVHTLGLSIVWFGKSWQDYLKLPILQLDLYVRTLEKLLAVVRSNTDGMVDTHEVSLQRTLDTVQIFRQGCLDLLEEARRREDISGLCRRIKTLDSETLAQLNLSDSDRRIIFQGGLSIKVTGQGPWQSIHAVLLDNYLLWGKVKAPKTSIWKPQERKGDSIWILENPIAISELQVTLPEKQEQFQRATYRDEIAKGLNVYEMFVKNKMSAFKAHTLGAFSPEERSEWHAHLISAIKGIPVTSPKP